MSGLASAAQAAFRLAFQLSPIVLTGGLFSNIPGQAMPIIAITEAANFVTGLLSGTTNIEFDNFFANFRPLPGASLIDQDIAHYPFANQQIAANAVITKPLVISLAMNCSARLPGGYITKLATLINLQKVLYQHNLAGGTYTIATPSFLWTDCVMVSMRDVTSGESNQPQSDWQLDFEQPLITEAEAQQAQNNMTTKMTGETPLGSADPTWSNVTNDLFPSLGGATLLPSLSPLTGAGVSGPGSLFALPGSGP